MMDPSLPQAHLHKIRAIVFIVAAIVIFAAGGIMGLQLYTEHESMTVTLSNDRVQAWQTFELTTHYTTYREPVGAYTSRIIGPDGLNYLTSFETFPADFGSTYQSIYAIPSSTAESHRLANELKDKMFARGGFVNPTDYEEIMGWNGGFVIEPMGSQLPHDYTFSQKLRKTPKTETSTLMVMQNTPPGTYTIEFGPSPTVTPKPVTVMVLASGIRQ